jgi:hypothetical protein
MRHTHTVRAMRERRVFATSSGSGLGALRLRKRRTAVSSQPLTAKASQSVQLLTSIARVNPHALMASSALAAVLETVSSLNQALYGRVQAA